MEWPPIHFLDVPDRLPYDSRSDTVRMLSGFDRTAGSCTSEDCGQRQGRDRPLIQESAIVHSCVNHNTGMCSANDSGARQATSIRVHTARVHSLMSTTTLTCAAQTTLENGKKEMDKRYQEFQDVKVSKPALSHFYKIDFQI